MIKYLLIIASFILDFLILNYMNATYCFPMFTIVVIGLLYSFFKSRKEFDMVVIFLSLFYGLLFFNNLALGFFLFFVLKEIIVYFNDSNNMNLMRLLLLCSFLIIVFDALLYLFLFMPFSVFYLVDKILKSLLLNGAYVLVVYCVLSFVLKVDKT